MHGLFSQLCIGMPITNGISLNFYCDVIERKRAQPWNPQAQNNTQDFKRDLPAARYFSMKTKGKRYAELSLSRLKCTNYVFALFQTSSSPSV